MRIALFADIHANREALESCLAHAAANSADRHVFLGDYVGYGADPGWVVDTISALVARGAIALLGNHDAAALTPASPGMNESAATAIAWTRGQLDVAQRDFLAACPLTLAEGERLYVHASACRPGDWDYITDIESAGRCFGATDAQLTFCGHVHMPLLYQLTPGGQFAELPVGEGTQTPLAGDRRWLAVIGAVGQPRDGNPAACYAMLDDATGALTFFRVAYDVETAARKILDAGLPQWLAWRLFAGR